jgi:hypothetical protein
VTASSMPSMALRGRRGNASSSRPRKTALQRPPSIRTKPSKADGRCPRCDPFQAVESSASTWTCLKSFVRVNADAVVCRRFHRLPCRWLLLHPPRYHGRDRRGALSYLLTPSSYSMPRATSKACCAVAPLRSNYREFVLSNQESASFC